jgi:guanine deaminase
VKEKKMEYLVKGTFIDTPTSSDIRCRTGYMLIGDGVIKEFSETKKDEWNSLKIYDHSDRLIIPGFSDLHLHAPQYSYCGIAMDVQLIEWLSKYTYPEEAKYEDVDFARDNYRIFVNDLKDTATTRSCIFASLHTDATLELMKLMEESGMASYVGKLSMNRNCPDYYSEKTTENGINETRRWIEESEKLGFKFNRPMITPRFTPSVTDDYMEALGNLSKEKGVPTQSHLSENTDEINWVSELCPDTEYYAQTYSRYGLFGGDCPTVMAHCIYSGKEENELMKKNGVYIAHCPTSNENVIAGIAPAAYYLRNGYNIGLGSDVAGGHTLNLFAVMAAAIQCSKLRWKYVDDIQKPITLSEAFYMATAGGGSFFGKVGKFEEGYEFDAAVIDDSKLLNNRKFTYQERLERYTYLGDGKTEAKYVSGRKIK